MRTRTWSFTPSDGSGGNTIADHGKTCTRFYDQLPDFDITPPGTLVLRNVDGSYDGTYEFKLAVKGQEDDTSTVRVFIASKSSGFTVIAFAVKEH